MNDRTYWLNLFSGKTWQEFLDSGATVTGFRESRWKTLQQMKRGDYLLCYMTGISRWIGILEVVTERFRDDTPIWEDDVFPARIGVRPVVMLTPETAIPIFELRDRLSIFQNLSSPFAWTGHLRGSPMKWKQADGEVVVKAVVDAHIDPTVRPVDVSKLARKPPILRTKFGPVTVPDRDEPVQESIVDPAAPAGQEQQPNNRNPTGKYEEAKEATLHTEVQWLLLKLGNDMGLDVWVARNDRERSINGTRFSDLPRMRRDLPRQFDDATNRTIRLIDVLWLEGNSIKAAFEIECTTSIYSGLLRMSDLIAVQPNLNIPLYIVAPEERRDKVKEEVNRPTFSRLSPPMRDVCRFISISTLQENVSRVGTWVRHLRPDFVTEMSESCEYDEI
jgi:hypothetical protein